MAISFATRFNADLLEQNYEQWRRDPKSVDPTWSAFFEGFELGSIQSRNGTPAARVRAPTSSAATASSSDWIRESEAERTCDDGDGPQWPNDRNQMCFTSRDSIGGAGPGQRGR